MSQGNSKGSGRFRSTERAFLQSRNLYRSRLFRLLVLKRRRRFSTTYSPIGTASLSDRARVHCPSNRLRMPWFQGQIDPGARARQACRSWWWGRFRTWPIPSPRRLSAVPRFPDRNLAIPRSTILGEDAPKRIIDVSPRRLVLTSQGLRP
jgi:hypothetical protein